MSVINAILFYSKSNSKSLKLKRLIDEVGIDLESICVDSSEVRERLLDDEEYGIDEVPSVLVIYSHGKHKVYVGKHLDQWFKQLLENIQQYQGGGPEPMVSPNGMTPIAMPPVSMPPQYSDSVKPLQPGSDVTEIPTSLPSPGQPLQPIEEPPSAILSGDSGMNSGPGNVSGARAAMIAEHIKASEPLIPISSMSEPSKPAPKGIKTDGISPMELAKRMAKEKENLDEQIDKERPFI